MTKSVAKVAWSLTIHGNLVFGSSLNSVKINLNHFNSTFGKLLKQITLPSPYGGLFYK